MRSEEKLRGMVSVTVALLLASLLATVSGVLHVEAEEMSQLLLYTDKNVYVLGENVTIVVKNTGVEPVFWVGRCPVPWDIFTYPGDECVFAAFPCFCVFELAPGETVTYTWNQSDQFTIGSVEHGIHVVRDNQGWGLSVFFEIVDAQLIVPDEYLMIQDAVDNADEGDTVFVRNGTYCEHVFVDKSISIVGDDATIIDGGGDGIGMFATADNVKIKGLSVQNCEAGIRVEGDGNTVTSNVVSSNGNSSSEFYTDLEVCQDYVSPLSRWYLHNLINGSYTGFFNITHFTPVVSVCAFGHEDVQELAIGLFYDENHDRIPQVLEFVGVMYRDKTAVTGLVDPPEGSYIVKVMGWQVSGDPGHFDLKIERFTGYGIGFFSSFNNTALENTVMSNPAGICLHSSNNTAVHLNNATGNISGITARDSDGSVISENSVSNSDGPAISLWSVHENHICGNRVSENPLGIVLWNSSRNELTGNDMLSNAGWGLGLHASNENKIWHNDISFSIFLDGIRMMFASHNNITENRINSNGHAGVFLWLECDDNLIVANEFHSNTQHGIELKFSDSNTIADNEVTLSESNGILIIESTNCTVTANDVFSNSKGIMFYDASGNTVYHNNIIDSWDQQGADVRSDNLWDNGCEGNYWSNYNGSDRDNDGVGDTELPWEGLDYYPLINPYWNPADVNHDLKVDIYDVVTICNAYSSTPSHPHWNPHCDITDPHTIIDIYDVIAVCNEYGKKFDP